MTGTIDIQWRSAPLESRQQESSPKGFAELFLSPAGVKNIVSFASGATSFAVESRAQRIDGYLLNWITENKKLIAGKGSNSYVPAKLPEISFFDQNVITPIMGLLGDPLSVGWDESIKPEIQRINNLAMALNYELILYHHKVSGDNFLILQEGSLAPPRHWGTYVFRIGEAAPYVIEVPRPLAESNTLAFGANLFERLDAGILLIAGTHPYANIDGSANLLHNANKISLFNLVHQTVLREARDSAQLVLQLRAFSGSGSAAATDTDVMLAKLGIETNDYPALTGPIEEVLINYGLAYEYVEGTPNTMGYDAAWNAQARYAPFTENKPFFVLWVSPDTRESYRNQEGNRQQRLKFATVGIDTVEVDVSQWLSQAEESGESTQSVNFVALQEFFLTENVVTLNRFRREHPAFHFDRLLDINTGQAFLAIRQADGFLNALVNLQTQNEKRQFASVDSALSKTQIQRFVDDRARWLVRGNTQ